MSNTNRSGHGLVVGSILGVVFLALATLVTFNNQYLIDQWNVWQYEPSTEIQNITERSGLSDRGKFYLYTSHAKINDAAEFNTNCARLETNNAVLGCYSNRNIYIYDINNQELDGIEEVTAAHEMLHAVWDRMNEDDRNRIGEMLEIEYKKVANPGLEARMAYYGRNESGERLNELHSIIATEVSSVDQELEKYYSKYFDDRQKTVALHAKYEQIFTQLATESDQLYSRLVASGQEIESLSLAYNQAATELSEDIEAFNNRANSGAFDSTAQFNAERAALVARTRQVDAQREILNQKIIAYNEDYAKYQDLAVRRETLNRSIDSTLQPAPSL